jgi:putative addiction module killer protein
MGYSGRVIEILETGEYATWFESLRDRVAKTRILIRIRRLSLGNFGDMKGVGEGVSELRIDCGPGYRVYFTRKGEALVVLLGGGDKRTQSRDIRRAIALSKAV